MKFSRYICFALLPLAIFTGACSRGSDLTRIEVNAGNKPSAAAPLGSPTIEAAPVSQGDGNYKLVSGDTFKLTVAAPNALEVALFYRPVTAADRALMLKTLREPVSDGVFVADLKIPEDFNGEVWGRATYTNGDIKETEHILLAKRVEPADEASRTDRRSMPNVTIDPSTVDSADGDTDESARSDKITGGKVRQGRLKPGDGYVRITVNVPAFKMTLWQGDKEIRSNYVGVGRKDYPIPSGMRSADKIILNPDWIPPDSEWVRSSPNVEPYERISADDPDNPLGKIKIPLGQAYLLHEAQSPTDIGNLVSHGCVRVMRDDLFEVTKLIARARSISGANEQIAAARNDTKRRVLILNGDIPVDINYDTMVVEGGVLTIYPDIYDKNLNTIENLRNELQQYGIDITKMDDATLKSMLDKVNPTEKFVIAIRDLKQGNVLKGMVAPVTPRRGKGRDTRSESR